MNSTAVTIRPRVDTLKLKVSSDRKTSTHARWRSGAQRWEPVPNAYGHARASCVGRTEFCTSCYAENLERYPTVSALLNHNWQLVQRHLGNVDTLAGMLSEVVARSVEQQTAAGVEFPTFRWHWDGDIPSSAYASAIRRVAVAFPEVRFWLYTRTLSAVSRFATGTPRTTPDNLAVYLSVDRFNVRQAKLVHRRHPWTRLAFCGDSWEETENLAASMGTRKGPRCPELTGRLPMVVPTGDGVGVGACTACAHCLPGGVAERSNVRFSTGKDSPR